MWPPQPNARLRQVRTPWHCPARPSVRTWVCAQDGAVVLWWGHLRQSTQLRRKHGCGGEFDEMPASISEQASAEQTPGFSVQRSANMPLSHKCPLTCCCSIAFVVAGSVPRGPLSWVHLYSLPCLTCCCPPHCVPHHCWHEAPGHTAAGHHLHAGDPACMAQSRDGQ